MARKGNPNWVRVSQFAPVLFRVLGTLTAIFLGRFLGSEGTAIMATGQNLMRFVLLIFCLILIERLYSSRMTKTNKYVRLGFYISILFSIYILIYFFLRIYLLGLFFSNISFILLSMLPGGGGQALPLSGPSSPAHSSTCSEDSFGIQVISEPWPIIPNSSLEYSIQARIQVLENANSIFIDKEKGQYWDEIKAVLNNCSTQQEYNLQIQFENRDLQILEKKTECYSLVREIVFNQPSLMENSQYQTPEIAIQQFCEDTRTDLEREDERRLGLHSGDTDWAEIEIYVKVAKDIRKNGPQSF